MTNEMGTSATTLRCETRKNTQTSGWHGNNRVNGGTGKVENTPYGGMGNCRDGNRDQGRVGVGKSRPGTKYARWSRSHRDPFPTRPNFPAAASRVPLGNICGCCWESFQTTQDWVKLGLVSNKNVC